MICPHCGAEVDDGAVFCTECGSRLVKDAVPAETSDVPSSDKGRSRRSKAVIVAGLVAILALGGTAGYYFGVYAPGQRRAAAQKLSYERAHGLSTLPSACPVTVGTPRQEPPGSRFA